MYILLLLYLKYILNFKIFRVLFNLLAFVAFFTNCQCLRWLIHYKKKSNIRHSFCNLYFGLSSLWGLFHFTFWTFNAIFFLGVISFLTKMRRL